VSDTKIGAGAPLADEELVDRVRAGDTASFEVLMRRHNQRVYRVARAVLRGNRDAEDVMQQAYVNAFKTIGQFEGRATFSTWLTRIVLHEALRRRRRERADAVTLDSEPQRIERLPSTTPDPEHQAYTGELRALLERAIDSLPEAYRLVFMLREVEGLSTSETAASLELGNEAVKTRLHRARAMLRRELMQRAGGATAQAFQFHLSRCDVVVRGALSRIALTFDGAAPPNAPERIG
jgi:RNA polymerase sigma-70 factor (ECF subfamily)